MINEVSKFIQAGTKKGANSYFEGCNDRIYEFEILNEQKV